MKKIWDRMRSLYHCGWKQQRAEDNEWVRMQREVAARWAPLPNPPLTPLDNTIKWTKEAE